jgi:hypothetical protein
MRAIDGERRAAVTNRLRERTTRARLSLVRLVILIAFTTACSSYSSVHDEASTMRAEVAACNDGDTCAVVDGINGDCTGLLGCPFPTRTDRASEAHARATDRSSQSRFHSMCRNDVRGRGFEFLGCLRRGRASLHDGAATLGARIAREGARLKCAARISRRDSVG